MSSRVTGFAPVEGTSLYYESEGEGLPVVLLHGRGIDLRMWDDQVAALASSYRVVRYDLRGFGRSAPGEVGYSHAEDLALLLDHLRLDHVIPIGLSLGGGAAINFAVLHPERVRALVAVDPSLGGFAWSPEFIQNFLRIEQVARVEGVDAARSEYLGWSLFPPLPKNSEARTRVRAMVRAYSGWHWTHPDLGRPLAPPAMERLGEIRVPTLVLVGERDLPDFHRIADTLGDRIPGARKVVMPGVGHLANLEDPETFNRTVLAFLTAVDSGQAG